MIICNLDQLLYINSGGKTLGMWTEKVRTGNYDLENQGYSVDRIIPSVTFFQRLEIKLR